jgi:DNA polymerase-3 subunit epsilon
MKNHELVYQPGEPYPHRCSVCLRTWKNGPYAADCMGKPCYYWEQAPEALRTFTQLKQAHLKPRDRAQPDAYLWLKEDWTPLYDQREAVPRRQMTPAQKEARAAAWLLTQQKYTCRYCGSAPACLTDLKRHAPGACLGCIERMDWWDTLDSDHQDAIRAARKLIARGETVAILDTETTDLDGVVLELGIIDLEGNTLFHSLINPECRVSSGARAVHGISDEELEAAPTLPQVWLTIQEALAGRTLLLSYNADFDSSILDWSARRYQLEPLAHKWRCLMLLYSQYIGEWSEYHESYRWQKLNGGHRALEDARAALAVLREMADSPEDEPSPARRWEEKDWQQILRYIQEARPGIVNATPGEQADNPVS